MKDIKIINRDTIIMEKELICAICQMPIDKRNQDYANVRDFHKDKFTSECFMHTSCWNQKFGVIKQLEMENLQGHFVNINKLLGGIRL